MLSAGTRLGPYQVTAQIGEGGMGQVFRARDTKLDRDVAIKVLPEAFAHDADRLARFTREAKTLASLNHPNIAAIYGLEESGGLAALVIELVEGDDLSQRIARGAIPLDEALPIAKQIAAALEAAHAQGIIHRDLKPANIKVRPDGTVKVLDFGLAKLSERSGGLSGERGNLTHSPTLATPGMTQAGRILGTAAYMSPEQARGTIVDRRADIWAFGAVVFEMLTGNRAFPGEDVTETLAAVVHAEPNWMRLPPGLSPALSIYIRRCLHKDPKQRIPDIAAMRLALEGAFETAGPQSTALGTRPVSATHALAWAFAGAALIVAGMLLMLWAPWRSAPVPKPRKLRASIGVDASLPIDSGASAILSPDGTTLAFVAQQVGQIRLFIRTLDQLQAAVLAGTEGAADPFFSPDGQWIAFFAGGRLKKVAVTGGAVVNLCDAPLGRGGTWADDDTILFSPVSANIRLMRVSAAGGTPAEFGTPSQGATSQRWPQALPGGKGVLYSEHPATGNWDGATLVVAPLSGGTPKVVVRGGHYGRYLSSGHLIYLRRGTLFAVRFDPDRLETVGQAVPVLDGVATNPGVSGGAQLAVSAEGTLVYVPGTATTAANPIGWLTRDGTTSALGTATSVDWANPRFSPAGQKLAIDISDGTQRDIWVYEWARDTLTQLTFDPGEDRFPVWTPDGQRIVFASDRVRSGVFNIYAVNADGTGEATRLTDSPESHVPWSWHPSGRFLAFHRTGAITPSDLMILPMEGDAALGWTPGKPTVFLSTPAAERGPTFSPDGRWIAYFSNEGSAAYDIYVRPFPGPGGKWRVSTDGGAFPRWSATTHELLFLSTSQRKIMAAPYTVVGESFRAATPQIWSPTTVQPSSTAVYDLHPDGKRVAAAAELPPASGVQDHVVFVFNFADYLRTIVPAK